MKRKANLFFGLLGGLLLGAFAGATSDSAANPYESIADRNVFRLREPPKPQETTEVAKPPPPKITLQGLTTILGRRQVLFKVAMPARPPEPAKEVGMVLNEGERESEIEVLEINETTGKIKFNNNGTEQILSMDKDAAKPPAGAAPPAGGAPPLAAALGAPPMAVPAPMSTPAITAPPGGVTTIGSKGMPNRTVRLPNTAGGGTPALGGMPAFGGTAQGQVAGGNQLDLETTELITEVQHQNAVNKGDPTAAMFPPTRINPTRNVVTPAPPPPPQ